MPETAQQAKSIFLNAVDKFPPDQWEAYLEGACGDDGKLRARVEELLKAHADLGSFHEPDDRLQPTEISEAPREKQGAVIGHYKLLQEIGRGGFGVVYMAEQQQPVQRKVALKIIKPGMDTREVIARFEAERQALAMMDHPNIARVLDAGATESGRPYFVMELVRGVTITKYCDQSNLSTRQRLELFATVCQAVQHAHQKGIIHRDIKPSNVMVTLHDGKPVVKVIDFGIAKATGRKLTDKTLFTNYATMIGTPLYMSPEQAELSGLDVDTRTDIYSLGVLLYELLTGTTPFDRKRLHEAAYDEIRRIIREEEPAKPSSKVSTMLGDSASDVASHRGSDPKKLSALISGDLDWIVMKALDKDRSRRYETANGFAADIGRYLQDEPVSACPPSAGYRFRKFARRNKAPMFVATAAALALIVVAIGSTIAARQFRNLARRNANLVVEKVKALDAETEAKSAARDAQLDAEAARDKEQGLREEAQRQTEIATGALADAQQQRERAEANFTLARSAVDEFLNNVTENELLTVPGFQPLRQELLSSAMEFYDNFTQDEENAGELLVELSSAHHRIAVIRGELGQKEASSTSNAKSIELFEKLRKGANDSTEVQLGLAKSYFRAKRYDDTESLCRTILETDAKHADTRSLLANTYNSLAIGDNKQADIAAALNYHQQSLALREGLVQEFPENANYLAELGSTINNLGVLLGRQSRQREALAMFERSVGYSAEAYSNAPQTIMWGRWLCISLRNVAVKQALFGEQNKALKSYQRRVSIRRKLAFENPAVPSLKGELHKAWLDLANYQRELNLTAKANRSLRAARDVLENIPQNTPAQMFGLAIVYGALSLPAEGTTESPEEHVNERQRFADLAMETIVKAVAEGYRDVDTLKSHKYLNALRDHDDFQRLVDRLDKEIEVEKLAANEADTDQQKLAKGRQVVDVLRELIGTDSAEFRHRKTLAATLHSIGEIQIGLGQYDEAEKSLREALELRDQMSIERAGKPQVQFDSIATRIALGRLHWDMGDYPEAHHRWQDCLDAAGQLVDSELDNKLMQTLRAKLERSIYVHYGSLGLFPSLHEFLSRDADLQRVGTTPGIDVITDGEFSAVVLGLNDHEFAHRYLRQLSNAVLSSCPRSIP